MNGERLQWPTCHEDNSSTLPSMNHASNENTREQTCIMATGILSASNSAEPEITWLRIIPEGFDNHFVSLSLPLPFTLTCSTMLDLHTL